ncbi:ArnT family glycosyltransferase [Sphingomonas sp. Leaf343]|uniref:ArnT family glycosyltransferase n=1 Tax=Sphingomonas sp. Leaf343 TaxID=1736345 RepID=UPI0006FD062F|nr:glycosyltransferase family 39 protein [Sphingomonas sp. Leaf343]KQR80442.1 hypothetical protein ASG07_14915 [Sphingomonas sp. Leaf343]
MTPRSVRIPWPINASAALLLLAAAYGVFSTPALIDRWGASVWGVVLFGGWAALGGGVLPRAVRAPSWLGWAMFGVAAIGLRTGSALLVANRTSPGDSQVYIDLAQHLLAGRGLTIHDRWLDIDVCAFYPPLYPLVLAGWGWVAGFSTASLTVLSTAIDLLVGATIVRLGGRIADRRVGIAAAALYLIWPATLFSAPLAQKEGLGVLLAVMLAVAWYDAGKTPAWRRAAAIGIPTGLLALTQPGWAPLALAFGLAAGFRIGWRRMLTVGIPAAAIAAVTMLPWWLRNVALFGGFVPLTSVSGLSLWIGNNPAATGRWMQYPASLRGLPELEVGHAAGAMAREWIMTHPADFVRLTAAKAIRALGLAQSGVSRLAAMQPPIAPVATAALLPFAQAAQTTALALTAAALRFDRRAPSAFLVAALAHMLLVDVWFEFDERHRDVVTPFLLLTLAAGAAAYLRRRTVPAAAASARPVA